MCVLMQVRARIRVGKCVMVVMVLVTKSCLTFAAPWTVAHQALLSVGFPRQEYWSEVPKKNIRIGKGWWGFPGGTSQEDPLEEGIATHSCILA